MNRKRFGLALLLAAAMINVASAAESPSPDPYADETPAQRDARMKWWREARFGMFIHWGVYAVPAGTYNGKQIGGIGEWIMNRGKIPMAEYQAYAKDFNPVKYDADAWVRLAKEAGMKYIVITSKHHDGFALFDSKVNNWDVVDATPYKKDLLKPLAEACKKHGLKLGFYYSQAQDWNNGGSAAGGKWDKAQERSMDEYIDKVAVPQVREILSNYGDFPAVLWWDTPTDMNKERADKLIPLLKLKPGIIHNNRLGGGYKGDTETPEQFIPATGYPGRDWETCMTMNDTWGFKSYDQNWKPTTMLIRNLVDIASKGGNYLLNVGPTAQGEIPGPSIERLKEVGKWMKVNGEAIYGTSASPFKRLPWGRCTKLVSGNTTTLFLHVFNWPADGTLVVPGLKNPATSAQVLAGKKKLKVANSDAGVVLTGLPKEAPDAISSTIVLKIKGAPEVTVTPITQEADGSVRLLASEAELHGEVQYESGHGKDNVGYWTNPKDSVSWTFKIDRPGKFKVSTDIAAEASGKYEVTVNDQKLEGTAPATKDYTKFKTTALTGEVTISQPGSVKLTVKPIAEGWKPMNLRSVTLKPATP